MRPINVFRFLIFISLLSVAAVPLAVAESQDDFPILGSEEGDSGVPIEYCRELCARFHGGRIGREYIECLKRCTTGEAASTAGPRATHKKPELQHKETQHKKKYIKEKQR